jgi:hypothetical protein
MATELKEYNIRHADCKITLSTVGNKNMSILALMRTLAREVKKTKPELWSEFLARLNQADQLSNEKKPEANEDENSDTFFERMMQAPHT